MPQLDLVSFLSQYFWLLVAFVGFYFYLYKSFLPKMYRIYSVRERLSNKSHESKSNFQPLYIEASKKKENLFANVLGYVNQTVETSQTTVESWKDSNSKQLLENSLSKFTNTFKKTLTLQSLSQFLVLTYAAPLKVTINFSANVLPKGKSAAQTLKTVNLHKLGDKKKWKSNLLKSPNLYVPYYGFQSLAAEILSNKSTSSHLVSAGLEKNAPITRDSGTKSLNHPTTTGLDKKNTSKPKSSKGSSKKKA